ncbi:MAG: M20/M25/M40 family metallo-hydrolase [Gemmatimonadales bacterium]
MTDAPDRFHLLRRLLDTPAPSGFELPAARVWREAAAGFADEVRADAVGNSFATVNPGGRPPLMFAGHVDEIGVIVVHVDDRGFVWFDPVGGWDAQVFVGQRVTLLGPAGAVPGVIGRKAIHLMEKEEREKVIRPHELWIDIGAESQADALARVRVGDPGVLAASAHAFPNGRLVSRSLDNRVGAWVVLEALRLLAADRPAAAVTAVATTQEEIAYGAGGARASATGLAPVAGIVVDVTHAVDTPGLEKKRHGEARLGGGPVITRGAVISPIVFERLVEAAKSEGIAYSVQAAARDTSTDADAIVYAAHGVATGLVSVPLRYMHSPGEMVSLDDVDATARLLAAFARRVEPGEDFVAR